MNITRRDLMRAGAFAGAAIIAGAPRPSHAATLAEIKARNLMIVATEDDFKPFEFVVDGKPTGYDTELLELFRKTVPFKVQQEIIPWTGLLPGVNSGKYDAAVTAALITAEREKFLDYCSPICEATDYYVKRKSDTSINSVKDLSGKKCGVQAGSAMLSALPELEAMLKQTGGKMGEVVQYVSNPEAYQDLAIGRTDYVVNTVINLQSLVNDKPDVFALGQAVSNKIYIAWAVKKGNDDVRAVLDQFLLAQRKNGQMATLQKKWFGKSFDDMPEHYKITT
jgi:polar amino acid transport system substrate-binding protein